MAVWAGSAQAAHAIFPPGSPFTGATDLFTDFPACQLGVLGSQVGALGGPTGVLDDGSHFFVVDICNHTEYRFPVTGGSALSPEVQFQNGFSHDLAVASGTYFAASSLSPQGLYSWDPVTLHRGANQPPPLAPTPAPATGLAIDPVNGDVYIAGEQEPGGGGIFRVQNPTSGSPTVTTIATDSIGYDGIAISSDGSRLYGARGGDQHVVGFGRSGSGFGGAPVLDVSLAPHGPDGVAVAPSGISVTPSGGGAPIDVSNNVFVDSNDGTVERIDVNNSNAVSVAAAGGTRGDFTTVGPDGCLYATQATSVEKLSPCLFDARISAIGKDFNGTEGTSANNVTVATFTDPDPEASAGDYSATIDWGDGSSSAGTISGPTGGPFAVSGDHSYAEESAYTVKVTITDRDNSANHASTTSTAHVADAALTAGTVTANGGVEGVSPTGLTFTFTDANPNGASSDFTATIQWGDGSSSMGAVASDPASGFKVTGAHTYAEEGNYAVHVNIVDDGGSTAAGDGTATVGDAPLGSTCATPSASLQQFGGPVANLTDANPNGTVADFTATIQWGDGSSSMGTISGSAGGPFTVSGNHTYSSTGPVTITTSVADDGGSTTHVSCTVLIFAFAPGGGSFVIGDKNSSVGTPVTFWGAQWWKDNSLSGGAAPASFKGFALNPRQPGCGTNWSTDPGNSAPPPGGPLPAHMGVIVTGSVTKSGSRISGDTPHIVIVKTNAGYQANPGHAGTGTVEAQFC
jgi:hypothetical protein